MDHFNQARTLLNTAERDTDTVVDTDELLHGFLGDVAVDEDILTEPATAPRLNEEEFGELFETAQEIVYDLILPLVRGNSQIAEDITSQTFLKLYEYNNNRGIRKATAIQLARRTARTLVVDHFRSRSVTRNTSLERLQETTLFDAPDTEQLTPEEQAEKNDGEVQVFDTADMFLKLHGQNRRVMELLAAGSTYEEIAAALGISYGAVKTCVCRARQLLSGKKSSSGQSVDGLDLLNSEYTTYQDLSEAKLLLTSDLSRFSDEVIKILLLRSIMELTFKQIAEIVSVNQRTAYMRYVLAIGKLRESEDSHKQAELLTASNPSSFEESAYKILRLKILERKTLTEIADEINLPYHTVYVNYYAALGQLYRQQAGL